MNFKYPFSDTFFKHKFGVDISVYKLNSKDVSIVYEETKKGHFEEFYSKRSTHTWFIISGEGTYVINDEKIPVKANDIISVPPGNRIHYFGKMKMLMITTPAFDESKEKHVRDVAKEESPYKELQ